MKEGLEGEGGESTVDCFTGFAERRIGAAGGGSGLEMRISELLAGNRW